jgi:hypothetical protein
LPQTIAILTALDDPSWANLVRTGVPLDGQPVAEWPLYVAAPYPGLALVAHSEQGWWQPRVPTMFSGGQDSPVNTGDGPRDPVVHPDIVDARGAGRLENDLKRQAYEAWS